MGAVRVDIINKVVIVGFCDDFFEEMKSIFTQTGLDIPEIMKVESLENIKDAFAECIIINGNQIKDMKNVITEFKKETVKIIIVFDTLNNPFSQAAVLMGADVFYRYAPMTALLNKIYGSTESSTEYPEKQELEVLSQEKKQKILAVCSSKGGTGKTTLSANIAIQYANKGLKVLVVDMAQYGNIGLKFRIIHRGTGLSGITTAIENAGDNLQFLELTGKIKESVYKYELDGSNMEILIAASPVKMESIGSKEVEAIIKGIRKMDYDVVIIDTSSELSQRNLAVLELSDEIILVASPELACGWNLLQMKDIIKSVGIKSKVSLVINRYAKASGFYCKELEAELEYPLICVVPECIDIQLASNAGQLIGFNKKHWVNVFYRKIAHHCMPVFDKKEIRLSRFGIF